MRPVSAEFCNGVELVMAWGDMDNLSTYKLEMADKHAPMWNARMEFIEAEVDSHPHVA